MSKKEASNPCLWQLLRRGVLSFQVAAYVLAITISAWRDCNAAPLILRFLYLTDTHSNLNIVPNATGDCYLTRVATLVKQIRDTSKVEGLLFVHGGDMLYETHDYNKTHVLTASEGLAEIFVYNSLKLDFSAAGNHEFDNGLTAFQNAVSIANFPFVTANITVAQTGRPPCPGGIVKTAGRLRVGLMGLTASAPSGFNLSDYLQAGQRVADSLSRICDVVVPVVHLGASSCRTLASSIDVPLIMGGHDHSLTNTVSGQTTIVIAQWHYEYLGQIDVRLDSTANGYSASVTSVKLHQISTLSIKPDSQTVWLLRDMTSWLQAGRSILTYRAPVTAVAYRIAPPPAAHADVPLVVGRDMPLFDLRGRFVGTVDARSPWTAGRAPGVYYSNGRLGVTIPSIGPTGR